MPRNSPTRLGGQASGASEQIDKTKSLLQEYKAPRLSEKTAQPQQQLAPRIAQARWDKQEHITVQARADTHRMQME
jgi:hypothetical protein